jgi:hypothetical protein
VLYAVGGVIAAGKSTVAESLSELCDAPIVDADRTRKHLSGVAPHKPLPDAAFAGHYDSETSARVYAELLRRAEVVLSSGRPVILDASFRTREHRLAALELAARHAVPFRFVECLAPAELRSARLVERAKAPSVSDGRLAIAEAFAASFQAVDELPSESHLRLDTGRPKSELIEQLVAQTGSMRPR